MARGDDYKTNISGFKSPFSIVLNNDVGLTLYGNSPVKGSFGPGEQGLNQITREVPQKYSSFDNGMGYAYKTVDNSYAFTINGYCRTPRKYMPAGLLTEISLTGLGMTETEIGGEIRCAIEYGSDVIIGAGSLLLKLAGGLAPIAFEYDLGAGSQVDSAITYNSIPIFSTDYTHANWQYLTGYDAALGVWKTAHQTGSPASNAENPVNYTNPVYLQKMQSVFQEVDGTGGWRLVGNDSAFTYTQIQSADINQIIGDTTVYGASLAVGDSSYRIQNIIATNRIFYILKVDGVYGIESAGIYCPNYTPNWRQNLNLFNGVSGEFFDGHIFAATYQGLERVDVSNRQRIDIPILVSPSYYLSNETPVFGIPVATTLDNGWLVVALWNGLDSHLCYTRPRENTLATSPNPMIWHGSECTLENQRITMLFKTSVSGYPQMLIGSHDGTRMHLYTLSLPREGDPFADYLHGGNHKFSPTSKLYLPFDDWKDGSAKKVIRRYDIQVDGLTVPELDPVTGDLVTDVQVGQIQFYANADSGSRVFFESVEPSAVSSEWQSQGTAAQSPKTTMIPSGTGTTGTEISILLDGELFNLAANPLVDPPVYAPFAVRTIKIRAEVLIEQMEERQYVAILGYLNSTNKGGRDFNTVLTKFSQLYALQDSGPVDMIDELGQKVLVKVEPGLVYELIPEREGQPPTYIARFSVTLLGRQFIYDAGQNFDSIYAWGG
jgi:hypothetical protein